MASLPVLDDYFGADVLTQRAALVAVFRRRARHLYTSGVCRRPARGSSSKKVKARASMLARSRRLEHVSVILHHHAETWGSKDMGINGGRCRD
jgi:hypothetical protein